MENKLQELTEKIYAEGVGKASKEAETIIEKAKAEAGNLEKQARKDAAQILEKAEKEAIELKKNVESEVRLSARQAISAIKQELNNLIITRATEKVVKDAFDDDKFIKHIIETAIKNWNPGESKSFDAVILLPEKDEKELHDYFTKKQKSLLDSGLELKFDENLKSGFKIGPKDDSYLISFTEEDFENFFKNYLRPRTTELLYSSK